MPIAAPRVQRYDGRQREELRDRGMHSCSHCNAPIETGVGACPHCGTELGDVGAEPPSIRPRPSIGPWHEVRGKRSRPSVHVLPRPVSAARHAQRSARFDGAAAVAFARSDGDRRASGAHPQPAQVVPLQRRLDESATQPKAVPAERVPVADLGEPTSPRERGAAITETGKHPTIARSDAMARPTPSAQFAAPRPLILASQALRRELAPATPAARPVQLVTAAMGLAGLIGTWLLCGPHGLGLPVGGALLALAVLGLVPMPYPARATSLATVSGSALAVVTWHRVERASDLEPLVLMLGVVLLASALLFRGWHRASMLARALVGIGIALCAGWLWTSQALQHLLVLESQVQAWLQPVLAVPFGLLLLLALLGFMDSRTTGGCALWGSLVLAWYGVHDWAALAVRVWPAHAVRPLLSRVAPEVAVTWFAAPLFAAVLAAALSQLLAVATSDESH